MKKMQEVYTYFLFLLCAWGWECRCLQAASLIFSFYDLAEMIHITFNVEYLYSKQETGGR